jgi:hypothetical protein
MEAKNRPGVECFLDCRVSDTTSAERKRPLCTMIILRLNGTQPADNCFRCTEPCSNQTLILKTVLRDAHDVRRLEGGSLASCSSRRFGAARR